MTRLWDRSFQYTPSAHSTVDRLRRKFAAERRRLELKAEQERLAREAAERETERKVSKIGKGKA